MQAMVLGPFMGGDVKESTQEVACRTCGLLLSAFQLYQGMLIIKSTVTAPGISGAGTSFPDETLLSRSQHSSQGVRTSTSFHHTSSPSLSSMGESQERVQAEQSSDWPTFCTILDLERLVMQRSYQSHRTLSKEFGVYFQVSHWPKTRKSTHQ